jgi:hypothetical protein
MVMTQLALSVNRRFLAGVLAAGVILLTGPCYALSPNTAPAGAYIYQVLREGQVIGQLRQDFERKGEQLIVVTAADITVTFLGLNIYAADQRVEETWSDGKLMSIVSTADVDGSDRKVSLLRQGERLVGIYNGKERDISAKLVPSTLWNSDIVKAKAVLDTSKGKARKVTVSDLGPEQIQVMGQPVEAHHYSIQGEFRRELWYDRNDILVAVEMQGKDGSTIRQELLQSP